MNIGRSIKRLLERDGRKQLWLASQVGLSPAYMSVVANSEQCNGSLLQKLADAFDMSVSEFVAVGEVEADDAAHSQLG